MGNRASSTASSSSSNSLAPSSFNHRFAKVNGIRLHFVDEGPKDGTLLVLVHGFPDLWFGWRHQIRHLASNGFRVIAPDVRGYGQSEMPVVKPGDHEGLKQYGWKNVCKDLVELVDFVTGKPNSSAIYIGHDWGGMVVWKMCLHYPTRIRAVASVCTAYMPPLSTYLSIERIVKGMPQLNYQLWFNTPEADDQLLKGVEVFFNGVMVGRDHGDDLFQNGREGFIKAVAHRDQMKPSRMLTREEIRYYVDQYSARGFHGALNYYRTRRVNYEDELPLVARKQVDHPALMVLAKHDLALPPSMADKMPQYVKHLTWASVEAAHWVPAEQPQQLNAILTDWLASLPSDVLKGGQRAKL
ncbi:hypothetical protein HK101_000880 [Irineochytrium annulatum]|nr:hypothetical protein HK101_000880 [Irineochytrium annulatum]